MSRTRAPEGGALREMLGIARKGVDSLVAEVCRQLGLPPSALPRALLSEPGPREAGDKPTEAEIERTIQEALEAARRLNNIPGDMPFTVDRMHRTRVFGR